MRFFITGVAGFIGSALANRLIQDGHEVLGIDDRSAGREVTLPPEVFVERGDVNDIPKLWTLMQGVDVVFHLAARVSVQESVKYPRDYNHVNVGGTVSVLEAMRDTGVKRLVFSSSGALYGKQPTKNLHEGLKPEPQSPYAVSKLASEHYIRAIGEAWNIETISLRIFNAYGPNQPVTAAHPPVIPQFFRQILGGGSVVMHGSGKQTRDFVYIDDSVAALARAATIEVYPGREPINVGSGVETSIIEVAELIGQLTGKTPQFLFNPESSPGVPHMCADLTRLKTALDIVPKVTLRDGLQRILQEDLRFAR